MTAPPAGKAAPSLRIRMLRHVMVPLVLTWLAGTVATLSVASHFTEQAFDRALLDDAYSIASHVQAQPDGTVDLQLTPSELMAALFDQAEAVHFAVLQPDGKLLAGKALPATPLPEASQGFRYSDIVYQGLPVRAVTLRHEVQGQLHHVVMAHTTYVRAALVQRMLVFEDALYAFHHMLGLQHLAGIQVVITLAQQQHAHGQQHGDGNQNNQPQAATDGQAAKGRHGNDSK